MGHVVDPSVFHHFGAITFAGLSINPTSCMGNLSISLDKYTEFKSICKQILSGTNNINLILMQNMVFNLTNENAERVNEIIIEVFNEITNEFHDMINNAIKNDLLTIKYFGEEYSKYTNRVTHLSTMLFYFNNRTIRKIQNGKKYSYINLIKYYTFYNNVINSKYDYNDGQQYYLYEIFTKIFDNGNIAMNDIIHLFKMYSFYIRFSYCVKENRDTLFNTELDKLLLVTLGSNQDFIKNLVQYIATTITTQDKNSIMTSDIGDLISLVSNYFNEKDMFNLYYEKSLENRLLSNGPVNISVEKMLANRFKRPIDNRTIQNIMYKLDDYEYCQKNKSKYEATKITIKSDKYNGIKVEDLKRGILSPRVFRYHAWSDSKEIDESTMKVPFDLAPYIDIYTGYYRTTYKHRTINWNFNIGTAIVKLTLGGKEYHLQLSTPQLFLLLQFNQKEKITAQELAELMGIPPKKLAPILNTFLGARQILKRMEGFEPTDPAMVLYLNPDFNKNNQYPANINISSIANVDKIVHDKFSIGRENLLMAKIIRIMKKHKNLLSNNLMDEVKKDLGFQLQDKLYDSMINECIKQKYIKKNEDGTYEYLEEEDEE